jgi:putative ABC transport system substrate-binding protein
MDGLRALGYIDGRNIAFEYRFADGDYKRLPALAMELAGLRPAVIYTHTGLSADAAANATSTIPIVVGPAGEATMIRLAGNLARPTRNVTGTTFNAIEQDEKCLELLKELAPRTTRVAVILNPENADFRDYPGVLKAAAAQLNIALVKVEVANVADLAQAFATIGGSGADAILLTPDRALTASIEVRQKVIAWGFKRHLPVVSPSARVVPDGGLVSLSTDVEVPARRAAFFIHRILRGAKPADLPIERPTTFKLSINRKTAATLGLTIPQSLLSRADEVIQ